MITRSQQHVSVDLRRVCVILICLLAAACSQQQLLESVSFQEDRSLAIQAVEDIASGDLSSLEAKAPPQLRSQVASALPDMRSALPALRGNAKLIDARFLQRFSGEEEHRQAYLAYELSAAGRHALAQFTIVRDGPTAFITEMAVHRLNAPVSAINTFSLTGKSWPHYGILLAAVAALTVTLFGLLRVWRSGAFSRRWLWTIGCLFGVTRFTVDWATGELLFAPLYIQVLSVGAFKPGVLAPWAVSVGIPVVALYVLFRPARSTGDPTFT